MKFSLRDWWLVNVGFNAMGALAGAIMHSLFLVVWNGIWVGIDLYAVNRLGEKDGQNY